MQWSNRHSRCNPWDALIKIWAKQKPKICIEQSRNYPEFCSYRLHIRFKILRSNKSCIPDVILEICCTLFARYLFRFFLTDLFWLHLYSRFATPQNMEPTCPSLRTTDTLFFMRVLCSGASWQPHLRSRSRKSKGKRMQSSEEQISFTEIVLRKHLSYICISNDWIIR